MLGRKTKKLAGIATVTFRAGLSVGGIKAEIEEDEKKA